MENIHFLESEVKMPLIKLPVRSTFLKIGSAGILISPGSCLTEDQLNQLSGVTDIVAPSLLHTAGVAKAAMVFPKARIWGVPNANSIKPEIAWNNILTENEWPYQIDLPILLIEGMPKVNEVVFMHKESKSIIVADLCFNLVNANGIGAWIILTLFGTYRKLGVSKFYLKFVKDKYKFESSLQKLFNFEFDNIILGHGDNVIGQSKKKLLEAFQKGDF